MGLLTLTIRTHIRRSSFLGERGIAPAEAMNQAGSFKGPLGHTFECIGCINRRRKWDNGPVLIWQV